MEKRIDLILHGARSGEENMALDREALARAEAGEASLRIYRWDRPTISLGRSQRPDDVADLFPGLPTVARPSGGGAVLHGFDLTVALALPLAMLEVQPRALRETYVRMVTPLAEALTLCGLPSHLAGQSGANRTSDCFASSGAMDLVHRSSGKKVAGCALAATRTAALLEASVPAETLPSWLPIDERTAARYSNAVWRTTSLTQAIVGLMNRAGFAVRLSELDPDLPTRDRIRAVLSLDLDATLADRPNLDSYLETVARELERAQTREERLRILDRWRDREDWVLDDETILRRVEGFMGPSVAAWSTGIWRDSSKNEAVRVSDRGRT